MVAICRFQIIIISALWSSLLANYYADAAALSESERVVEHKKRYKARPPKFIPETDGWRRLYETRLRQVAEVDDLNRRYEGYIQTVTPAFVAPNFTEFGFGLAKAPAALTAALQEGIRGGLERGEQRFESKIEVIEGDRPWFIDRPDLTKRVR